MVINVIVVAVTLLMAGFVGVWLAFPRCRPWIEAPKWQPLAWDEPVSSSRPAPEREAETSRVETPRVVHSVLDQGLRALK